MDAIKVRSLTFLYKNLIYPLLPFKNEGLTIHPLGKFIGVYFSEELKAVKALGYKIRLIEGFEFSKANLFHTFINNFYEQKRNSIGAERLIAKLHLNTLYGYFGRSLDLLETLIIKNKDIGTVRNIKNIYKINNEYSSVLTNKEKN